MRCRINSLTCLTFFGLTAVSAGAQALPNLPTNGPYIDPSIVQQVQQNGGTVTVDNFHNSITINEGGNFSFNNGNAHIITPDMGSCGACVNVGQTQPQFKVLDANLSVKPPITLNDAAIARQIQAVTGHDGASSFSQPKGQNFASTAANLSPSAGGAYDPITAANGFLQKDGLGGY